MFRIRPFEKILTPGEFHCCDPDLGGRTPAEFSFITGDESDVVEDPVNRWITFFAEGSIFFTICCKSSASIDIQAAGNPNETVAITVNEVQIFAASSSTSDTIDIPAEYLAATGDELKVSPCGWSVEIAFLNEWIFTLNI